MVEEYEEQEEQKNLKERKNLAKDGAVDAAVEVHFGPFLRFQFCSF